MKIVTMKIGDIRPYEKNPRINDGAVEAVANSIKTFGWRAPIVVDKDLVVVCGHTRLKSAQLLGLEEVPVHIADNLTPEEIQAYRIADNKTAELADWNYDLLPLELRDLQTADFDLSLLGFDTEELDKLLNGSADDTVTDGETDPDAIPEVPEDAVSKRGEVVLDTFGGSGSTLMACEQTGRLCRTMELDPKYCDVIRRRWAEFIHGEGYD